MSFCLSHLVRLLAFSIVFVTLSACGGGGGGSSTPPPANTAPQAAGQSFGTDENTALDITLSGSDADGDTLTYEVTVQPANGALSGTAPDLTYTPDADYIGSDSFRFTVNDGTEDSDEATVSITVDDTPAQASADSDLGIREAIVVTFDEEMDPTTLELGGLLAELSDGGSWNEEGTEFTLSPTDGTWESGLQKLTGHIDNLTGSTTDLDLGFEIRVVFENYQAASVVIGQPDFESKASGLGPNKLSTLWGRPGVSNGRLWLPDYSNNRVLGFDGIPEVSNADATWVVGQPDFVSNNSGTSDQLFDGPQVAIEYEDRFYMLEYDNNRISIFDDVPLTPPAVAANVIGQPDLSSDVSNCTADGLSDPETMVIAGDKLIVADSWNNRVLVWNQVPAGENGTPADLVLGQSDMTHCTENDDDQNGAPDDGPSARTLFYPAAVWSDGERLVVSDGDNSRVLIWNSFPSANFEPADVVLGQPDFVSGEENNDEEKENEGENYPTARTLSYPNAGLWSNGLQLFVEDNNCRVLVWNTFPSENYQPADVVLGKDSFTAFGGCPQAASEDKFIFPYGPGGLVLHRDKLVVFDTAANRALVFEAQ